MVGLGALLMGTSPAAASGFDVLVFHDGTRVQTGLLDKDCFLGTGEPGCNPNGTTDRVYEGELVEQGAGPVVGFADEPGFFSVPDGSEGNLPNGDNFGGAFVGAAHSIDLTLAPNSPVPGASILFWDGTGPVSWSAAPNGEFFDIEGNGGSGGILGGSSSLLGIDLDAPDANGFFDTHPDFFLFGNGGVVDPTVGFYAIFGRSNVAGLDSSAPWSLVFDFGVEDEGLHEAAIDNVNAFIPEPGTASLLGLGLLGLGVRGRRCRVR